MTDTLHVIDDAVQGMPRWAGAQQRALDGKYLAAYERMTTSVGTGLPHAYARESSLPYDWAGSVEYDLSALTNEDAVDPTWMRLPNKKTFALWTGWNKVWIAERTAPGVYAAPVVLWRELPFFLAEATATWADGKAFVAYVWNAGYDPATTPRDVRIRTVANDLTVSGSIVVAANATGLAGSTGMQVRPVVAPTGVTGRVLCAWVGLPDANLMRPIMASLSDDSGATWGAPFALAQDPAHDFFNPAPLYAAGELRVYYAQTKALSRAGYASSTDGGLTWARHDVTDLPPSSIVAHSWPFWDGAGRGLMAYTKAPNTDSVVCFSTSA